MICIGARTDRETLRRQETSAPKSSPIDAPARVYTPGMSEDEDDLQARIAELCALRETFGSIRTETVRAITGREQYALGSLYLGEDVLLGIISELDSRPPRALNAIRLARHLWEAECDLHYVDALGDDAVRQVWATHARNALEIGQATHPDWRSGKKAPVWKERSDLAEEAEKREATVDARRRACLGMRIPAAEHGFLPSRRTMLKAVGRADEMPIYYGAASLLSHPSLQGMSNLVGVSPDGEVGPPLESAVQLPAMRPAWPGRPHRVWLCVQARCLSPIRSCWTSFEHGYVGGIRATGVVRED